MTVTSVGPTNLSWREEIEYRLANFLATADPNDTSRLSEVSSVAHVVPDNPELAREAKRCFLGRTVCYDNRNWKCLEILPSGTLVLNGVGFLEVAYVHPSVVTTACTEGPSDSHSDFSYE